MKYSFVIIFSLILTLTFGPIYAQEESKSNVLLNFNFLKPSTQKIQEHVDYKIAVLRDGAVVFGPSPLTHSITGEVSIPLKLVIGKEYLVTIEVHEILFSTIPTESTSFRIIIPDENIQRQFTSNNSLKISLAINKDPFGEQKVVPNWLKTSTKWWAEGSIDDSTFIFGIQYLIEEKIIDIPKLPYPASWMDKDIPIWVKNNAGWWADDLMHEDDFVKGIKYLVEKGIIHV